MVDVQARTGRVMGMLGVRAVVFDAGNTLAMPDWSRITAAVQRVSDRQFDDQALQRELFRVLAAADSDPAFLRELGRRGIGFGWHYARLFSDLGLSDEEVDRLLPALREGHEQRHLWARLNPEAPPVLEALRERGFLLAVISNSEDGQLDKLLEEMGILHLFDLTIDSHLFGTAKPDPRIFHGALERLEIGAAEGVYVGDMYTQDVEGAERAGLHGVLYDPLELQVGRTERRIRSLAELVAQSDEPG